MRRFVGIDLGREPVPDETTVCKFRHLLEGHELGKALLEQVHRHLDVGVDSEHKLIHSVVATAANVADSQVLPDLLHGQETRVYGDQAYRGQTEVIREHAAHANDFTNRRYRHNGAVDQVQKAKNRIKSKVRAKVEHAIGVIKRIFGFVKVRYRGLEKNANRLFTTCALANLYLVRAKLLRVHGTHSATSI
jgi:IS5 family transposase